MWRSRGKSEPTDLSPTGLAGIRSSSSNPLGASPGGGGTPHQVNISRLQEAYDNQAGRRRGDRVTFPGCLAEHQCAE